MLIATLNAVLEDGGKDDIVAIGLVENEHEGELWFNENKPDDGTQVDYVLHKIPEVFAAPETKEQRDELLEAAQEILRDFNQYGEVLQQGDNGEYGLESSIGRLTSAIEKAEKGV